MPNCGTTCNAQMTIFATRREDNILIYLNTFKRYRRNHYIPSEALSANGYLINPGGDAIRQPSRRVPSSVFPQDRNRTCG